MANPILKFAGIQAKFVMMSFDDLVTWVPLVVL